MSESTPKFRLTVGTWIALITLIGGGLAAFITLRTETSAGFQSHEARFLNNESRIFRLEARDEQSRLEFALQKELLIRIDERTAEIKRKQDLQR